MKKVIIVGILVIIISIMFGLGYYIGFTSVCKYDCNKDGDVNIGDVVTLLNYITGEK